jgi:hypothetical protein
MRRGDWAEVGCDVPVVLFYCDSVIVHSAVIFAGNGGLSKTVETVETPETEKWREGRGVKNVKKLQC